MGWKTTVDFLGWLDETSMQAEYSRCAVAALVSWQETAPVAIAQAMAAGKGVVASDVGGVRYLLADGRAGLLVQPEDVDGQAAALRRLLFDADLRRQLGEAARREAQTRFRVDVVAADARAVYEQVIQSSKARISRYVGRTSDFRRNRKSRRLASTSDFFREIGGLGTCP